MADQHTTQSAIRAVRDTDGRYWVTVGDGLLLLCPDQQSCEQAAKVIDLALNAGMASALSIKGVELATKVVDHA